VRNHFGFDEAGGGITERREVVVHPVGGVCHCSLIRAQVVIRR
jgi:hypothetical protein